MRTGAINEVRCNYPCDLIATINAKGSSQQTQPIKARNGAIEQHLIIPLTHLGVGPLAFIRFVCPFVIFDLRDENWLLVLVENDQEDNKVYGITRIFIGGSLRGKEEGEGAFNHSVVEQPVVRAIITRFEWRISVAIDMEDVE